MSCSDDAIEVNTKSRRRVGDVLDVNRQWVKCRKSGNSYAKHIQTPSIEAIFLGSRDVE